MIELSYRPRLLSFGFPKTSEYRELFNYNLLRQSETGVRDILVGRSMKMSGGFCGMENDREPEDVSIGMMNMASLFFSLIVAFMFSVVLVLIEHALSLKKKIIKPKDVERDRPMSKKESAAEMYFSPLLSNWERGKKKAFLEEVESFCHRRVKELLTEQRWKP